jgi:S1-C subfamily serine protease
MQVERHGKRVRLALLALLVVTLSIMAILLFLRARQKTQWERERTAMRNQIDSLLRAGETAVRSLQGEVRGLSDALRASEAQVREASQDLDAARARMSDSETQQLRRQLQASREALRRLQLAASLDFRSIESKNRRAIAMIWAEAEDGKVSTATAFAVRPSGLLVTSRHLVSDARGQRRPRRLALQFADSDQLWNASVTAVSQDADVALVRVSGILGNVPTIHELNLHSDTIASGSPVAVIGFPMGGIAPPEKGRSPAQPLLSAALIRKPLRQGRLEIEGYGAAGASGSPIFDKDGKVVGVLFGGYVDPASGQNVILGASMADVLRLLVGVR